MKHTKLTLILLYSGYAFAGTQLGNSSSISQIHSGLGSHQFSCESLITGYINRIQKYNLSTIKAPINAITVINPEAISRARELDNLFNTTHTMPGDLFCVPVVVKDNIDVLGLDTSAGSYALQGTKPLKSALIVHNLEQQNAIILAKTSMDELACGMSGYSSKSGRVGNAYNPNNNPGGSSGGSAAAIAANFAPLALGSDNSGSVRVPAEFNGVYGLRPTYGLTIQDGIFPMGNLDGTLGPIAQNVTDLATLLHNMVTLDHTNVDYTKNLNKNYLKGKRIAVIKQIGSNKIWEKMPKDIRKIYQQVIRNLQKSGVQIIYLDLPDFNLERKYNMAGTIDDVNDYLSQNLSTKNDMLGICNSGKTFVFGESASCRNLIQTTAPRNSATYKQVQKMIATNQQYLVNLIHLNNLDGLFLPSGIKGSASYEAWDEMGFISTLASNSGLPSIVIPVAQDKKHMPVAMEIVDLPFNEDDLLGLAYAYEQNYYKFTPPNLTANDQFTSWSITELNTLYQEIGKLMFLEVIKPNRKNSITSEQAQTITTQAIKVLQNTR